jgi:hypothetical protein
MSFEVAHSPAGPNSLPLMALKRYPRSPNRVLPNTVKFTETTHFPNCLFPELQIEIATLQVLFIVFVATLVRSAFGFGEALVAVPPQSLHR